VIAAGVAGVILIALVVNGVVSAASSSSSYLSLINRSFATQANVVIAQQVSQGRATADLLTTMPSLDRLTLQHRLDSLVARTASSSATADLAASPAPSKDAGRRFSDIVAKRARAAQLISNAVSGLLGTAPLPVEGSAIPAARAPTVLLSSTGATNRLIRAGGLLAAADAEVGPLRSSFVRSPGHPLLHRSVFIANKSLLSPTAMSALVVALQGSSSLAIVHQLELTAVSIRPTPLPVPGSTVTNLPPSRTMKVVVVVRNLGNVTEPSVTATVAVTPQSGGLADSASVSGAVAPSGAITLDPRALRVRPGTTVTLTVMVSAPAGQSDRSGLSQSFTVVVAPATTATTVAG